MFRSLFTLAKTKSRADNFTYCVCTRPKERDGEQIMTVKIVDSNCCLLGCIAFGETKNGFCVPFSKSKSGFWNCRIFFAKTFT